MALTPNALRFLWDLVSLYWLAREPERARQLAASIYDQNIDLPESVEIIVVDFWMDGKQESISQLALILTRGFYCAIERHIVLVALLVEKELMSINEAATILNTHSHESERRLSLTLQHVIDIAWLVNQDAKDGVMPIQQDDLLFDALQEVLAISVGYVSQVAR